MADKVKKKLTKKSAALKKYKRLSKEYAELKRQEADAKTIMNDLAPKIRELAKEAGLDKTKKQYELVPGYQFETRFGTIEKYDSERLHEAAKAAGLKNVLKQCFRKVYTFDRKEFERMEEAGDIPQDFLDSLEEGENPIYWVEDTTPALYLNPVK